jgi:hypothetical protein
MDICKKWTTKFSKDGNEIFFRKEEEIREDQE